MEALAISARVAEAAAAAIAPLTWRALRVADRPNEDALLALLGPARPVGAPPVAEPGDP
jgi:uroporphyrinogen-III synthase